MKQSSIRKRPFTRLRYTRGVKEGTMTTPVESARPFNDEGAHSNPVAGERPTFADVVEERVSRRAFLKGASALALGVGATGIAGGTPALASPSSLTFKELPHGNDEKFHVAHGYDHTS
jgi:hypothetical protein